MPLHDWNHDGKRDIFDHYMDMKIIDELDELESRPVKKQKRGEPKGISFCGKPIYDSTKDSNGAIIVKSLLVIVLCIGGIMLPIMLDVGTIGTLLCILGGVAASIAIIKNV